MKNCYNTGSVACTNYIGGVLGQNIGSGTVTSCYYLAGSAGTGNNGIDTAVDDHLKTKALDSSDFGTEGNFSGLDFGTVWTMESGLSKTPSARPVLRGVGSGSSR